MLLDLVTLAMADATRHGKKLMQFSFILPPLGWHITFYCHNLLCALLHVEIRRELEPF